MDLLYDSDAIALLLTALQEAFATDAELAVVADSALGVAWSTIAGSGETLSAGARRLVEEAERRGRLDALVDAAADAKRTVLLEAILVARHAGRLGELARAQAEGRDALLLAARQILTLYPGPTAPLAPHRGEWEEQVKQCDRDAEALAFASSNGSASPSVILLPAQEGAMQRHFVGRLVGRELRRGGQLAASPTEWLLPPTGVAVHDPKAVTGFLEAGFQKSLAEAEENYRRFLREEWRGSPSACPLLTLHATLDERDWRRNPALTRHLLSELARLVTGWRPATPARLQLFLLLSHDDAGSDPTDRPFDRLRLRFRGGSGRERFAGDVTQTLANAGCTTAAPCPELGPGERGAVGNWAGANPSLLGASAETVLDDAVRTDVFQGYSRRRMSRVVTRLFELRRAHRQKVPSR